MILLPIGHEENSVRRLPLVTFGIMALCLVLFILSGQSTIISDDDIELMERSSEAFEYYWEHPYLELDDEFETLVYGEPDAIEQEFGEFAESLDELFERPEQESEVAEQQAELDRLTAAVLESRDGHSFFRWGLIPSDFSFVALFSHMFMHAGWLHLIGNLLILYLAGPFIEDVWGRPLYAGFYVLSGVAAAAAHIAFNTGSDIPMIGASGAIAGVMGAFLVHYHQTKIKFFYLLGFFIRGTFDAPAWLMLPLWLGEQLAMALMVSGDMAGVAYWAHIGGFGFGLGAALAVRRAGLIERFVQPKLDQQTETTVIERPGLDQALVARSEGRTEDAFTLLGEELGRNPAGVDTAELYWETAEELDCRAAAVPLMLRSAQAQLRGGEVDSACAAWERIVEVDPAVQADAAFLLRLTRAQVQHGDRDRSRETLRRALLSAGATPPAGIALRIARLGQRLDPAVARGTVRALLQREDVSLEDKSGAQALLDQLDSTAPVTAAVAPASATSTEDEEAPQPIPLALD